MLSKGIEENPSTPFDIIDIIKKTQVTFFDNGFHLRMLHFSGMTHVDPKHLLCCRESVS